MTSKKIENLSFEQSLTELENIVQTLEQGDVRLEQAMSLFERGLNLSQSNQTKLKEEEQKIQILMNNNGQQNLEEFTPEEQDKF